MITFCGTVFVGNEWGVIQSGRREGRPSEGDHEEVMIQCEEEEEFFLPSDRDS